MANSWGKTRVRTKHCQQLICGKKRCPDCEKEKQRKWRETATLEQKKAKSMQVAWRGATHSTLTLTQARAIIANPPICPYCGITIAWTDLSIDHKVPRSRGGTDNVDNIVWVDLKCNMMKGNLTADEFTALMAYLKDKPQVAEILSTRLRASGFIYRKRKR